MNENQSPSIIILTSLSCEIVELFESEFPESKIFGIIDTTNIEENNSNHICIDSSLFFVDKSSYFSQLYDYVSTFSSKYVICIGYSKLLPKYFIDWFFENFPKSTILNIHLGDLSVYENRNTGMRYAGLYGGRREMNERGTLTTTLHTITDGGVDTGEKIAFSKPTILHEISTDDNTSLSLSYSIMHYHMKTKTLPLMKEYFYSNFLQ